VISVIATIELRPGTRDAYLPHLIANLPLVRAEAGCIEYVPMLDVASGLPAQGPVRENVIVISEKWSSLEALHAHLAAPHMGTYRTRVKDYVARVSLDVLTPLQT